MKKHLILIGSILLSLFLISCSNDSNNYGGENWLDAPSLKEAFVDGEYFERFGLACEYGEISNSSIRAGLAYHANSTTPGNELKPDFVFAWNQPSQANLDNYTDSNGTTIKVPKSINFAARMDPYLDGVRNAGLQMRGHVLTWHSQTPEWFFRENYKTDTNLVDKKTMTARHEWYIRSVLEHVAEYESRYGYGVGNHLIYSWDVVNEAVADDADNDSTYLRGSTLDTKDKAPANGGSRWFQIYGNDEFIVNAFRFANAYAPEDVTLCYNDYNEYMNYDGAHGSWKTNGIIRLLSAVKNGEAKTINGESVKPRIDAMGMQSHVGANWPGVTGYETALKRFLEFGLDVQITEFDIATSVKDDTSVWKEYFTMLKKYSKKNKYNGHCITGITLWGINDENSWIGYGGSQYPLIFKKSGGEVVTKNCFYSVLNTVK